jgi:FAD/FMN-containing dehydrogenase/pimeloyl-ACP methyl ester carboxylesterase
MATQQAPTHDARGRLLAQIPAVERQLTAAGISTAVLEGGDGAPLLLLHGPAANAAHWMRVFSDLVQAHRVIAPDLPGHGASAAGDGERMADWLADVIEATCPEPPTLVGLAAGGAIAARFAADHGDRISRLVLVDTLGLTDFAPAPRFGVALHGFLEEPNERTHDDLWHYCALDFDRLRERMGDRWEPFRAYNLDRATRPGAMAALGGLMAEFGMQAIPPADLARIAVPTALIWGRDDLATSLSVAETASERYGWPLHVIDDCADDPPLEQPAAFVQALRTALGPAGFQGETVTPADPRYDELRKVYNGMIDRRPALIARCTDAHDVATAVTYARDAALPLSVYGGGHNVTGNAVCDDGVVVDLRPMKGIEIDPERRTCRAEAGLTWGELDAATQEHGLAVTGGRMSSTGIGGLVLGGGSGWIERKCGYAVDNLLALELVTADGRILEVSETEHPDLFWAARGAGANFGVATRFELRLHPIGPTVLGGILIYPAPMAAAVLRNFRDAMADAPDEVGSAVALLTAPHHDFVPEAVRGQPVVGVLLCYAGAVEDGEAALRPLREFGPPALDLVEPMPYTAVQQLLDADYPSGMRNYWTGEFLRGLPDEAIDVLVAFHASKPSPLSSFFVLPGGGAAGRTPSDATVLDQRAAAFNFHITSLWSDPADDVANIAWTRELSAAMQPFATGRVYVNFIGDEGEERVVAAYGGPEGYARLQAIKDRYDRGNLFRSSLNISPRSAPGDRPPAAGR